MWLRYIGLYIIIGIVITAIDFLIMFIPSVYEAIKYHNWSELKDPFYLDCIKQMPFRILIWPENLITIVEFFIMEHFM